jgi:hypothetical protein
MPNGVPQWYSRVWELLEADRERIREAITHEHGLLRRDPPPEDDIACGVWRLIMLQTQADPASEGLPMPCLESFARAHGIEDPEPPALIFPLGTWSKALGAELGLDVDALQRLLDRVANGYYGEGPVRYDEISSRLEAFRRALEEPDAEDQ